MEFMSKANEVACRSAPAPAGAKVSHARQNTHQTRPNQKQSLFTQSTSHIYSYCACTSPTAT